MHSGISACQTFLYRELTERVAIVMVMLTLDVTTDRPLT